MAAGLWVFGLLAAGCAEGQDNRGKTYLLRHAGITLARAAQIAESNTPGRAVKVELRHKGNAVLYEVEIIDIVNQPKVVLIDAETGKVVP